MLPWWHYVVGLFTPLFLVNAIPHTIAGLQGRRFPTPFVGGPPNLDSPQRNILWGFMNFVVGSVLLWLLRNSLGDLPLLIEMLAIAWFAAWGLSRVFSRLP